MKNLDNHDGVMVIAHRGGSELFFENTMTAFKKAQDLGVDAIECDVHLSKDKHLVIMHDPDLKRVAGIDKKISDMLLSELSQIELKNGEHIPTLEQVLEGIDIPIIIELKSPQTIASLSALFEKDSEFLKKCVVISFFHQALLPLKERYPSLVTGALLVGFPVDPVSVVKSCKADILSLNFEGLTKEYVDLCHKGGIKVSVWTPNTEKEIQASVAAGVDSLASDRPDIALNILGRSGKL